MAKIFLGADHAGFKLKEAIKDTLRDCEDLGAKQFDKHDDYPDFAKKVCRKIQKEGGRGILVCGTGQGMAIAANKFKGIRASVCWNKETVTTAAEHNDANIICLPGKLLTEKEGIRLTGHWLGLRFSGEERHKRRLEKIKKIEAD